MIDSKTVQEVQKELIAAVQRGHEQVRKGQERVRKGQEQVRKSREAGFVAHLTKPVDFQKLQVTIAELTASNH